MFTLLNCLCSYATAFISGAMVVFAALLSSTGSGVETLHGAEYYRIKSRLVTVPTDIPSTAAKVYLTSNLITKLTVDSFNNLSLCTLLNLNKNRISGIDGVTFVGFESLQMLSLYGNNLSELRTDMWTGLNSLRWLDLGHNIIKRIPSGCFQNLHNLEWLYLSKNNLTAIEIGMWSGLQSLIILRLDQNKLTTMPPSGGFGHLAGLVNLRLNDNQLSVIRGNMWDGLTALAELDLDNNKLLTIEPGGFYTLPRLSELRLSGNQLNALNWNIFSTVQTGSSSDSSSDLTETPGSKTSHRHPSNLTLSLHDNPLVCNSDLCWLKQGEKDGWLKWYTAVKSLQLTFLAHKPHCANQPYRTWDNIILNCSGKSKMIF